MKTSSKTNMFILLLICVISNLAFAILTRPELNLKQKKFTEDPQFGCQWVGGLTPGVNCTCRYDAEELYVTEKSLPAYNDNPIIEINKCQKVRFGGKSIAEMRNLRQIKLNNIKSLHFEESSLIWYGYRDRNQYQDHYDNAVPSLKIQIENSHITQISSHTFEGRINSIYFNEVEIENIDAFAFNSLTQTQRILFKNTIFNNINLQVFKKFTTETFELIGVKAHIIPSRFMDITAFDSFIIKNCTFNIVRPSGFIVTNPKNVEISHTKINQLDGEAFRITTKGNVIFQQNEFNVINDGAFRGIRPNIEEVTNSNPIIFFDSNVFTTLTRDSLSSNDNIQVKYLHLNINRTCDCKNIEHNIKETEFYTQINCLYKEEFVTVDEYKSNMCSIIQSYSTVIIIVGVVITVSFIILTVLCMYYKQVYRSKKYGNDNDKEAKNKGNMSLIVPDGRTYRETELHVIVERADLLTTDL